MNALTRSLSAYWSSSIGKKLIVALTGVILVLFLAGHLAGNMLLYVGAEAFDEYAHTLHTLLHGAGIWIARITLLTCLVAHVAATIALTRQNRAARQAYECKTTIQASISSRIMIVSGLTILAFVVYHLLHLTVRIDPDLAQAAEKSPYLMTIIAFQNPFVAFFYILFITLLCSHLHHGVASIFQTLGLRSKRNSDLIQQLSVGYSLLIWVGFVSIPVSICLGLLK